MMFSFKCILVALLLAGSSILQAEIAADKSDVLISTYKTALETKDISVLMNLVYWKNVEANIKEMMQMDFKNTLTREVETVEVLPIAEGEILEYERNGVTYAPNLVPIGRLNIVFKVHKDETAYVTNSSYLVGEKESQYMITTAAPVE